MVKTEFYQTREDGVNLFKSYSDQGFRILKLGTIEIYDYAIDVENSGFEYIETDELIETII